jgi:hypothetical protein
MELQSKLDSLMILNAKKSDWDYILSCDHNQSMAHYNYCRDKLNELGVSSHGYHPEVNQTAIQLKLVKGKPETKSKTIKAIITLLPHLIPVNGIIRFSILESTCGEYGIYQLIMKKKWELIFTRYGNTSIQKTFDTLKEAIDYIYENHYYEE